MISETASVTSPSSVVMGLASLVLVVVTVHPGIGCTPTDAMGVSVGSCTTTWSVVAVASSLGTRNVTTAYPPRGGARREDGDVGPRRCGQRDEQTDHHEWRGQLYGGGT